MKKIGLIILFGGISVWGISQAEEISVCTMQYEPVCAEVQVQCIKAPCPAIKETFGNKCMMNANKLAKFLYEGECKTEKQSIKNTKRVIQSFDDEIATGATLSFGKNRIEAKVCNSKSADYSTDGNKLIVGPMITTEMACMGDIGKYEQYFDLSGATYELSSDGGNHLMITTTDGHQYQRQRLNPNPGKPGMPNPASTFCIENSGTLEILNLTGGQYGVCKFVDGSKCDEWKYFRGECKPAYKRIHNIFDKFFEKYNGKFEKLKDKMIFLENFKSRIETLSKSKGTSLNLKKSYQKIIQAIMLYL